MAFAELPSYEKVPRAKTTSLYASDIYTRTSIAPTTTKASICFNYYVLFAVYAFSLSPSVPELSKSYSPLSVLPHIFPFVQMSMTASIYTTMALAVERYLSIREPNTHRAFPVGKVLAAIAIFSFSLNFPR